MGLCVFVWVEHAEMQRAVRGSFHLFTDSWIMTLPWGSRLNWKSRRRRDLQGGRKSASFTKIQARNCSLILLVEGNPPTFLACTVPFVLESQVASPLLHSPAVCVWQGSGSAERRAGLLSARFQADVGSKNSESKENRGLTWLNPLSSRETAWQRSWISGVFC